LARFVVAPLVLPALLVASAHAQEPQRPVRDVTPPGVLRVFRGDAGVPKRWRTTTAAIDHPLVKPDGILAGDDITLKLDGIAFPALNRLCIDTAGQRWACGRRAYIALYNKVHDSRVDCLPKNKDQTVPKDTPQLAECFVGDLNLAEWLLREGLVTRTADAATPVLTDAENAARQAKLGLWRDRAGATPQP
jgi:endonuclease YncB( thermonuclease family)